MVTLLPPTSPILPTTPANPNFRSTTARRTARTVLWEQQLQRTAPSPQQPPLHHRCPRAPRTFFGLRVGDLQVAVGRLQLLPAHDLALEVAQGDVQPVEGDRIIVELGGELVVHARHGGARAAPALARRGRGGRAGPAGAGTAALGRRAALRARGAAPWPGRGLRAGQASALHRGEPAASAPQRPRPSASAARPPGSCSRPRSTRPGPRSVRARARLVRARLGLGPARLCPAPLGSGSGSGSGPLGPAPLRSLQDGPRPVPLGPARPRSARFGPARPRWRLPRPPLPSALRRGVSRPTPHGPREHAQTERVHHAARDPAPRVTLGHVGAAAPPPVASAP